MLNIPTVTRNLLVANVVCFLLTLLTGQWMDEAFGLHFFLASDFHLYQLFTYMFMHGGFTHLLFNMFALWMFGCAIENVFGARRFLVFYLVCGIGAGLFQEAAQYVQFYGNMAESGYGFFDLVSVARTPGYAQALNAWTTVGASGAIYGILLAFGMTFPDERIFIIPIPFPIKAKWFVMGYAAIEVFSAMATPGDGVAHLAHLGGMVVGFFLIRYWRRHPYGGRTGWRGPRFFTRGGQQGGWGGSSGSYGGGSYGSSRGNGSRGGASRSGASGGGMRWKWGGKSKGGSSSSSSSTGNPDWDYNARQRERQAKTDRILDKIRRSGYDSLSADEKQFLFDNSQK